MNIREKISTMFGANAFAMPLFYEYEGGLRFELSQGGHFLRQFLTAHRKGMKICEELFESEKEITICFKIFGGKSLLSCLSAIRELKDAGLFGDGDKEHWTEFEEEWKEEEDFNNCLWHYLALKVPFEYLENVLWCAFALDFGIIKPNPQARVYIFNFDKEIMVCPYDDRGMDVVGPNHKLLKKLYGKFNSYLLNYDRAIMDGIFSKKS